MGEFRTRDSCYRVRIYEVSARAFIPYLNEISHLVNYVKNDGNGENRLSGQDALRDLEVIAKAYKNQIE